LFDVYVECGCGSGQQLDGAAHALTVTAPNAERCARRAEAGHQRRRRRADVG